MGGWGSLYFHFKNTTKFKNRFLKNPKIFKKSENIKKFQKNTKFFRWVAKYMMSNRGGYMPTWAIEGAVSWNFDGLNWILGPLGLGTIRQACVIIVSDFSQLICTKIWPGGKSVKKFSIILVFWFCSNEYLREFDLKENLWTFFPDFWFFDFAPTICKRIWPGWESVKLFFRILVFWFCSNVYIREWPMNPGS